MIFNFELSPSNIFMVVGFLLSLYSCVSNDVIQTLGTFISSNRDKPTWYIWAYASAILVITLVFGWVVNNGDMSFGRLDRIPFAEVFHWWHVLPPLVLLGLTRFGIPVSTTFLILSVFSSKVVMGQMILKSAFGYLLAFVVAIAIYFFISRVAEKYFYYNKTKNYHIGWVITKWAATGFLWSQWIMQDVANLFVYLPRKIELEGLIWILFACVGMLWFLTYNRGGAVQRVVRLKTNTKDIRSAAIIDIVYALILFYFKNLNNLPMSTTWVFVGLLAGREIAIYNRLRHKSYKKMMKHLGNDFTKVTIGLAVSVIVVEVILHIDYLQSSLLSLIN